ncbi:hypothetical protein ACE6H2_017248 [Prunus campanulata]
MASSSATATASPSSSLSSNHIHTSVSNLLFIKLDRNNYPLWLAQITPILKSRGLMQFVDGTSKCPSAFLQVTDEKGTTSEVVNSAYEEWIQTDQMVLSWINGSLTPTVLGTVVRSTSARATWLSLANRYASPSHNRILQLRSELLRTSRGDLSISDFLDKLNGIVDSLALAGYSVPDNDLISIIMNNVGPLYETTVSSAQARESPISYHDLEALLLSAERRLHAQVVVAPDATPQALYAGRSSGFSGRGGFRGRATSAGFGVSRGFPSVDRSGRGSFSPSSVAGSGSRFFSCSPSILGQRPPSSPYVAGRSSIGRILCQICNRPGHSAINCYNRMNLAFEGRLPTQTLSAMASNPRLPTQTLLAMATPASSSSDPRAWLLDTGANAHITSDLGNLHLPRDYRGDTVGGVVSGSQDGEDAFPRLE